MKLRRKVEDVGRVHHRKHARHPRRPRATQYHAPSWIGSTRTLQSGGYNVQVMLQNRKAAPVHWFDDHDVYTPADVTVRHQRRRERDEPHLRPRLQFHRVVVICGIIVKRVQGSCSVQPKLVPPSGSRPAWSAAPLT